MQLAMHISAWADGDIPPVVPSVTKFEVKTTSSYYKAGIYSAAAIDPTVATVVNWGDGTTDEVYGDISQLIHTYAAATATYTVEVSDNISTFALSIDNSTWYANRTKNNKIITKLITLSSRVTTLPIWAFYHCEYMGSVYAGDSGSLTLEANSSGFGNQFYATAYYNNGKFDFSGRTVQTIPAAAFADTGMTEFAWPKGVTTVGGSPAAANGAFYWAGYMTSITIPATITSIGDYAFARCETWKTITMEGTTAPTVASTAFGNSTSGVGTYVGRSTYSTGTNRLIVPAGSTGYDTGVWLDPLCDATKCGFTKVEV